ECHPRRRPGHSAQEDRGMAQTTGSPEDVIRQWARANIEGDVDTWYSLVLDGFSYVHSASNLERKPEMVEAFRNGRRYSRWDAEDMTTQDFGGGAAVVTGIGRLEVPREPPVVLNLRFTATLLDRDGWKLAAVQTTRLPEGQ